MYVRFPSYSADPRHSAPFPEHIQRCSQHTALIPTNSGNGTVCRDRHCMLQQISMEAGSSENCVISPKPVQLGRQDRNRAQGGRRSAQDDQSGLNPSLAASWAVSCSVPNLFSKPLLLHARSLINPKAKGPGRRLPFHVGGSSVITGACPTNPDECLRPEVL